MGRLAWSIWGALPLIYTETIAALWPVGLPPDWFVAAVASLATVFYFIGAKQVLDGINEERAPWVSLASLCVVVGIGASPMDLFGAGFALLCCSSFWNGSVVKACGFMALAYLSGVAGSIGATAVLVATLFNGHSLSKVGFIYRLAAGVGCSLLVLFAIGLSLNRGIGGVSEAATGLVALLSPLNSGWCCLACLRCYLRACPQETAWFFIVTGATVFGFLPSFGRDVCWKWNVVFTVMACCSSQFGGGGCIDSWASETTSACSTEFMCSVVVIYCCFGRFQHSFWWNGFICRIELLLFHFC